MDTDKTGFPMNFVNNRSLIAVSIGKVSRHRNWMNPAPIVIKMVHPRIILGGGGHAAPSAPNCGAMMASTDEKIEWVGAFRRLALRSAPG